MQIIILGILKNAFLEKMKSKVSRNFSTQHESDINFVIVEIKVKVKKANFYEVDFGAKFNAYSPL